ncbi:tonB-system energizer ExbB [Hyphomicrobium sp.]|uniref:tonB-system energizer ExbB n=1 Tax=Hyphomicrobium sp. TaxID=82 RepID=UPI002E360737|nr:tonB-system energizer ExbB [Hyphomicrobium sp.]HEX2841021.1 tonB-system energizer ExbB [Hyphomicrobium sp.]
MTHQIGSKFSKLPLVFAAVVAVMCVPPLAHAQERSVTPPISEAPVGAQPAPAMEPEVPAASAVSGTQAPPSAAETAPEPVIPTQASEYPATVPDATPSQKADTQLTADQQTMPATSAFGHAQLPHDLSPWNMFLAADIIVKAVMIGLIFASVVTWTVWLAKSIELAWAKKKLKRAAREIAGATSLAAARQAVADKRGPVAGLLDLAATELRLSSGIDDKAGIKERVASRLDGLTLAAGRHMNRGTGVLATIGSTAPFVGLFGTVWGIMNSFIGISESQTTNLAVVAPGIAEALLATAIGLVAAIPAVIIYNQFARAISSYKASVAEASAEVLRLVSRDLDRGTKAQLAQAAE